VIRNVVARAGAMVVGLAGLGCGSGPAVRAAADAGGDDQCSQLHRAISRWQGDSTEFMQCGPDVTGLLELTPLGYHQLVARRRFSSPYDLWTVSASGGLPDAPTITPTLEGGLTAGVVFLPGPTPHVLIYDPLDDAWRYAATIQSPGPGQNWFDSPLMGTWSPDSFHTGRPGPAGHELLGLEDAQLLDRDLGDGSTRVWQIVQNGNKVTAEKVTALAGDPRDELARGHRVVPLGGGRLLEWQPSACPGAAPSAVRECASYRVWPYSLDATVVHPAVGSQPLVMGVRSDIGAGDDILADDTTLYVWTRASGRLRSVPLDPTAADPFPPQGQAWPGDVARQQLVSKDWDPPTTSPAIKHLVVILQDGRSFDSYFGQYCQSPFPSIDDGPNCDGDNTPPRLCCEQMHAAVAGAGACAPIGPLTEAKPPHTDPSCMKWKMANGEMSRFAVPNPDDTTCGDPLDFACAGPDLTAGTPTDYWDLLASSALADNFFQTYAYADEKEQGPFSTMPPTQNLLYLETARFADTAALDDTPLLSKYLAHVQIPWAIYGGTKNLPAAAFYNPGAFYDPDWYPYRYLAVELDRDIALGTLPSVALVVPDPSDEATSEAPGHPVGPGIAFVKQLQNEIVNSPIYGANTLVLLTYVTAGGYYDHVPPPAPPDLAVDGTSSDRGKTGLVYYGPRVPLLAFSPFARKNQVSHVRLELTSITRFIEWNWQRDNNLKGGFSEARRYRDTIVHNLGSLIDPHAAQIEVPNLTE
jgi:hypothetical protein